jgi:alpha-amylase
MQTGLPAGTYSELVTCSEVTVAADGTALVTITNEEEPIFAICQGCDCGDAPIVTATGGPDVTPTTPEPTTPGPTEPSITDGIHRTVIFVYKQTNDGQDLFIRGGIDASVRPGCTDDVSTDPCAIDIAVNSLGDTSHYDKYNAWSEGDTRLDWFGAEAGQGTYGGQEASGSPLAWTSSDSSNPGYQELNTYGDHYWMLDVNMDCSQAEQGWFEVKAYLTNDGQGWEGDIAQAGACGGSAGGSAPYASPNHIGRCGYVNVFSFDDAACTINTIA